MSKYVSLVLFPVLVFGGYQRPGPFADKRFTSFEYTVRHNQTGKVFNMKLEPKSARETTWVFRGTVTNRARNVTNLVLKVPQSELDKIKLNTISPGRVSIDGVNGEKSGYSLSYANIPGPGPKDLTYTGSLFDPRGATAAEYKVVTDPGPLVVIVVVILAVSLCEAIVQINDCSNSKTILDSIAACKEAKGLPKLTISTTFGVSFSPHFDIGCHPVCEFECMPNR